MLNLSNVHVGLIQLCKACYRLPSLNNLNLTATHLKLVRPSEQYFGRVLESTWKLLRKIRPWNWFLAVHPIPVRTSLSAKGYALPDEIL